MLADGEKYKNSQTCSMRGKTSVKESTLQTSLCVCTCMHAHMENKRLWHDSVALHHKFILVSDLILCNGTSLNFELSAHPHLKMNPHYLFMSKFLQLNGQVMVRNVG